MKLKQIRKNKHRIMQYVSADKWRFVREEKENKRFKEAVRAVISSHLQFMQRLYNV